MQKTPSAQHRTKLSGCIFATKARSAIGKKNLLTRNISSACPHSMVNVGPLTAEIGSGVWGTPANFDGFHILASLLHRYHSMEVNQTLHDVLPSPGLLHYIYTVFHKKRGSQFMSMTIKS